MSPPQLVICRAAFVDEVVGNRVMHADAAMIAGVECLHPSSFPGGVLPHGSGARLCRPLV
jgi:hypothetical protein